MPVKLKAARTMVLWAVAMLTASWVTAVPLVARPSAAEQRTRAWAKSLVPMLAGTDSAARKAALTLITKQLQAKPYPTAWLVYGYWLAPLMISGHYRTVAHLARQGILAAPAYTGVVDRLLIFRIQALAAMHRNAAALRNAKSLFNVCTMADTGTALLILDQRLDAVYHDHPGIVRRFIHEERTGSQLPADDSEPINRSGVLASIDVHGDAYLARLKSLSGSRIRGLDDKGDLPLRIRGLEEKGDLLLLADHPAKALKCFQSMEAYAKDPGQLLSFQKFVCRAIRAQDGTIGWANAYLLRAVQSAGPTR